MEEDVLQQQAAKAFGRKGGLSTYKKYGSEHYRKMQQKGIETKKRKKKTGT